MFIVNKQAIHLFNKLMSYEDCSKVWREQRDETIPFGEYILMLGLVLYAEANNKDIYQLIDIMHFNSSSIVSQEISVTRYDEL
jgi:hypothetical protein